VALLPSAQAQDETPLRFALGPAKDVYAYIDDPVLSLTQQQERLVLTNPARLRSLDLPAGQPQPGALAAVALRHENRYYGVLWAAYNQPRSFSDEDLRFFSTLAGQAALAAANAHLFRSAEVGRQRLAAILASTPDPVVVTDQQNRLLLANPAAKQALGAITGSAEGQPTERVIAQKELVDLLQVFETGKQSTEVVLPDGKVYFATASSVLVEGRPVGRVCVLRDITHLKELDALKSDFVATVSHDLRSPLTLMRGYATMLEMVGNLNEQQRSYIQKMIGGVENMSRLVNNLLDLGRIEAGVGLQVEQVALKDVIESSVDVLQIQSSQKNVRLGVEAEKGLPPAIEADRALLQQAVYNLVENAIKYTPEGGWIVLRVKARPEGIQFEVQDSGIGIAPADQPRLFEKFYRGSQREAGWPSSVRWPSGTGARSGWRARWGRGARSSCSSRTSSRRKRKNPPDCLTNPIHYGIIPRRPCPVQEPGLPRKPRRKFSRVEFRFRFYKDVKWQPNVLINPRSAGVCACMASASACPRPTGVRCSSAAACAAATTWPPAATIT
jgi:PAS domain S-box-containing protein